MSVQCTCLIIKNSRYDCKSGRLYYKHCMNKSCSKLEEIVEKKTFVSSKNCVYISVLQNSNFATKICFMYDLGQPDKLLLFLTHRYSDSRHIHYVLRLNIPKLCIRKLS